MRPIWHTLTRSLSKTASLKNVANKDTLQQNLHHMYAFVIPKIKNLCAIYCNHKGIRVQNCENYKLNDSKNPA